MLDRLFSKEAVPRQHDCSADEQAVGDVEVWPSVTLVTKQNPIANCVFVACRHVAVVPESEAVVEVTANAARDAAQCDGQQQIASGAEPEEPD